MQDKQDKFTAKTAMNCKNQLEDSTGCRASIYRLLRGNRTLLKMATLTGFEPVSFTDRKFIFDVR